MGWTNGTTKTRLGSALRAMVAALVLSAWFGSAGCDDTTESPADASTDPSTDLSADTGVDATPDAVDTVDSSSVDIGELTCTLGEQVAQFAGSVTDEDEQPEVGAKVQICIRMASTGVLRCLSPVDTDASGNFVIEIGESFQCMESAAMRVVRPGTSSTTTYCNVDIVGQGPTIEVSTPFVIYETTPATTLPPAGDTSAERTVVFADGLEIDVVPDDFSSIDLDPADYGRLAATRLDDVAGEQCFLADAPALDGLYAFSPEADVDGDGFPMRIPNTTGLAAGTTVSLFILGGLKTFLPPDDFQVHEAQWYEYGTGTVATGGDVIEAELPYFSWFGYRAQ